MGFRLNPAVVVLLVIGVCVGSVAGLAYLRDRRAASPAALARHLPAEDGVVLAINLAELRSAGVLASLDGAGIGQEPEYTAFIEATGFDYQQDLDYVLGWFGGGTTLMLLRGRFDWSRLKAYAAGQGGECRNSLCRMSGSAAGRHLSFFPLRRDVMAMGVGADDWAATRLMSRQDSRRSGPPARPVWLHVPAASLRNLGTLPAGTRLFAQAMAGAENVGLSLTMSEKGAAIELDATCPSAEEAATLSFQLEGLTRVLREMIAQEKQAPNPGDLSGVLASGVFNRLDRRVVGRWPVEREFLEGILRDPQ